MTRKTQSATHNVKRAAAPRSGYITVPTAYVTLKADAPLSKYYKCGKQTVRALAHVQHVKIESLAALEFPCYDVKPGATITLTIAFAGVDKDHRPKGLLRLRTDRGKLSDSFIELDGKKHEIKVTYTAPDETIKVSVRVFLDGFGRGKAHLHLA